MQRTVAFLTNTTSIKVEPLRPATIYVGDRLEGSSVELLLPNNDRMALAIVDRLISELQALRPAIVDRIDELIVPAPHRDPLAAGDHFAGMPDEVVVPFLDRGRDTGAGR